MSRYSRLEQTKKLDPIRDHQRVVFEMTCYEFPFDMTRSLEFALFRTFASESVSALLRRTGEFTNRTQKRYDDTDLIISEFTEHGYDSPRGRAAIRRMNRLHHRFDISNEDYLYVLSTFVFEPVRWMEKFAWRPMCDVERLSQFEFWRQVGHRMNIKDIPEDYDEFERFNIRYEQEKFRYAESNKHIAEKTRALFLGWFLPKFLHPIGAPFINAMLDNSLIRAFGFRQPWSLTRAIVRGAVRFRSFIVRMLPAHKQPKLRTTRRRKVYPNGYTIETLGPDIGKEGEAG